MAAILVPSPKMQFFTAAGVPLVGGKLYTYAAGTVTPLATYTDAGAGTQNANPVVLDSRGEASVWFSAVQYYLELKDIVGATVWTADNVNGSDPRALASLAASSGSSLVGFIQAGTGAVATTAQAKMRETVSVFDFMSAAQVADVKSNAGSIDVTLAIADAADSLTSGQTLLFPGGTYLVSYQWTAFTDTSANAVGRGRAICYIHNLMRATLSGQGATIKCVDHPINTKGGLLFCMVEGSPGFTIDGFNFDMSFTGYNNSASYYPMCGGMLSFDVSDLVGNTQSTICSSLTAKNLIFKLYHPLGAYAITSNPYAGDVNNGYKVVSVFCGGDTVTTTSSRQNRNLTMENITFLDGHNGYGTWAYAYHNAEFKNITAESWVTCQYVVDTATQYGVSFLGVVRYQQYLCQGLKISGVVMKSRPWASRTGAFVGYAGGLSLASVSTNVFSGGATISNCIFLMDNAGAASTSAFDVGIIGSLGGSNSIVGCTFMAWSAGGAWAPCIQVIGYTNTAMNASYTISDNLVTQNISGPFVAIDTRNAVGDSSRGVKSVVISNNVVNGWGAEGAIWADSSNVYYSVESLIVNGNIFAGVNTTNANTGIVVNCKGRSASDLVVFKDNIVKNGSSPYYFNLSTANVSQNIFSGNLAGNYTADVAVGSATVPTSDGAGVTYPVTQSSSTNSNCLDDYKEGTFTPNQGAGLTVVGAFSSTAKYTKIGNLVHVSGSCAGATSVAVTATGAICSNMPYAQTTVYGNGSASNGGLTASSGVQIEVSSLYAIAAIAATGTIYWSVTYMAAT